MFPHLHDANLNPTLVCVSHFAKEESLPVQIFAGGAPPGYQGDSIRFHVSKEFSMCRINLYQTPDVSIGHVKFDLEDKIRLCGHSSEFKTFVIDICPDDTDFTAAGGYFGQFAMVCKVVFPRQKLYENVNQVVEKKKGRKGEELAPALVEKKRKVSGTLSSRESERLQLAREEFQKATKKEVKKKTIVATDDKLDDKAKETTIVEEKEKGGEKVAEGDDTADITETVGDKEQQVSEEKEKQLTLEKENENEEISVIEQLLSAHPPDHLITKRYDLVCNIKKSNRKKFSWAPPGSGTYSIISSCPEILAPMESEINIPLGVDEANRSVVVRLLVVPVEYCFSTHVTLVIRREDNLVVECLRFSVEFVD